MCSQFMVCLAIPHLLKIGLKIESQAHTGTHSAERVLAPTGAVCLHTLNLQLLVIVVTVHPGLSLGHMLYVHYFI